jgi:hypothetical protein
MLQKLKTLILSASLLFAFLGPVALTTGTSYAQLDSQNIHNSLCNGSNIDLNNATQTAGANTCPANTGTNVTNIIKTVINVLSVLVGAIAVVMIIFGGFRYVTSAGNDTGVAAAKKTILYALIGLVIVAFAQVVVHFVLNNVTTT